MVTDLSTSNSILCEWIREIRDVSLQGDRMRFRRNMERIGEVAAYEISKIMHYTEVVATTPLGESPCKVIESQPVIATILRAGLPLHQGLLNYFDKADAAFVAAYRKHHRDGSFTIEHNYVTSPELAGRMLIMADPMLATGASINVALEILTRLSQPSSIHIVSAVACSVGIEMVKRRYPEAHIWTGAIDDELTGRGYIVPGLGDAGDLSFGGKVQH